MTTKQACIVAGVAAAVLAVGYLATKREVHATITAGEAEITYNSMDGGAAAAPTATVDSHQRMMELIELSSDRIRAHDAAEAAE